MAVETAVPTATAIPHHYDVRIEPDLDKRTFKGAVTIAIKITVLTVSLKLHVNQLAIQSTTLKDSSGNAVPVRTTNINRTTQVYQILFEVPVTANTKLVLHQTFTGVIRRDGRGFHIPVAGQSSFMAATHLEPKFARTVFPCFDDPAMKASFSITLVAPRDLTCLSNMPPRTMLETTSKGVTKQVIEFQKTPRMSPGLVALALGEFNYVETPAYRVPIRAYCPQSYSVSNCQFALEAAGKALEVLERMLKVPYPLPKLDLILVPGQDVGMGSWGLITLDGMSMLVAKDNSACDKLVVIQRVAQEVAHQWFGNLITMREGAWRWLMEGLAEWAELEVRERMGGNPETGLDFVSGGCRITGPYRDQIVQKKGCAMLRMVEAWMGRGVFLEGIKLFLQIYGGGGSANNKTGVVEPWELWDVLSHVSGVDIGSIITPWTTTEYFPIITIEEDEQKGGITLTQTRFRILDDREDEDEKGAALLPIPVHIQTKSSIVTVILKSKSTFVKTPLDFLIVNTGHTGLYRSAYTPRRLVTFYPEIEAGNLCVEDRIGLLSNVAALALSGHASIRTTDLLSLLQNFVDDESFFVWKVIISLLNSICLSLLYEKPELRQAFSAFWKCIVKKCLYRKGTFSLDDDINEQRFKAMMFGNAGGDKKVFKAAEVVFHRFVSEKVVKGVNANLRKEVCKLILSQAKGRNEYEQLRTRLKIATLAERHDILCSLGYSQDTACIKRTIKLAQSPESVTDSEVAKILMPLVTHKKGVTALWKLISSESWRSDLGSAHEKMAPVVLAVLSPYTKPEQAEDARKLFKQLETKEHQNALARAFVSIELRARWLERDKEDMMEWLNRNGYGCVEQTGVFTLTGKLHGVLKLSPR